MLVFSGDHAFFPRLEPGHIVIFWRTGGGKTNTAKLIASFEHIDFLVDLFGDTFNFTEPRRYMF